MSRHPDSFTIDLLINIRSVLYKIAHFCFEHEIATRIGAQRFGSTDTQSYLSQIRARPQNKIVFQIAAAAIINDINTWPNIAVAYFAIIQDLCYQPALD